jgi:hypothetical protein
VKRDKEMERRKKEEGRMEGWKEVERAARPFIRREG